MTSAAYGLGRDSIAGGAAVGCPVSAFIATANRSGGLPDEESRTRHAPSERGALGFRSYRKSLLPDPPNIHLLFAEDQLEVLPETQDNPGLFWS